MIAKPIAGIFALTTIAMINQQASAQPGGEIPQANSAEPSVLDAKGQIASVIREHLLSYGAKFAKGAISRFRRGTVLAPFASVAGGSTIGENRSGTLRIGGGLVLWRFDIPLTPTIEEFQELVLRKVLDQLATNPRGLADREFMKQLIADAVELVMAQYQPRRFEPPSLVIRLEGAKLQGPDQWEAGLTVGKGVGPIAIGLGIAYVNGEKHAAYGHLEINKPMTLSRGLRSPVAELFVRAGVALSSRDVEPNHLLLGVRLSLDVL